MEPENPETPEEENGASGPGESGETEGEPKEPMKALPVDEEDEKEVKKRAARERLTEKRKIPKEKKEKKKKKRSPFAILAVILVLAAGVAIVGFFVVMGSQGPTVDEILKTARNAEKREELDVALTALDEYLATSPSEQDASRAQEERDRIGKSVEEIVDRLEKECRELLEKGDPTSVGEALSRGDSYLRLAPLVGRGAGDLEEKIKAARGEWKSIQTNQKKAETAFSAGKVEGELKVPAGKYVAGQTLVISKGSSLILRKGGEIRFLEDRDLVVRDGGKLILEAGTALRFDGASDISVNLGGEAVFKEGVEVSFGQDCGLIALGKVKAEGTKEKPVSFAPQVLARETVTFTNLLFDGAGASGSVLKHVQVSGGIGRSIPSVKELKGACGGGIAVIRGAEVLLENVRVTFCNAAYGGGLFVTKSKVKASACVFESNKAAQKGGGVLAFKDGVVEITGGEFLSNTSYRTGGGLSVEGGAKAVLEGNVKFSKNKATRTGGGLACDEKASVQARDVLFEENQASYGGGFYMDETGAEFTRCTFKNNVVGGAGGGGFVSGTGEGKLVMTECVFEGNGCQQDEGGGLYVSLGCRIEIEKGAFRSNRASVGGGVYVEAPSRVKFKGVVFEKNEVSEGLGRGGAVAGEPPEYFEGFAERSGALAGLEFRDCTFTENRARFTGGAISAKAMIVLVRDCVFEKNRAEGGSNGGGGALSGWGGCKFDIADSRFEGNGTGGGGGALFWRKGGELRGKKLLFQLNEGDKGGGADLEEVRAVLEDCEFTENKAEFGGALHSVTSRGETNLDLRRCIFRTNEASRDGGALFVAVKAKVKKAVDSYLRIEGGRIEGNRARSGGGLFLEITSKAPHKLTVDLKDLELAANQARRENGGAIAAQGAVILDGTGLKVERNRADKEGGAFFLSGAKASLYKSSVRNNDATKGGGVFWKGVVPKFADGTTVEGNRPDDTVKGE